MTKFLPYGRQTIDDDDIKAVVDILKSDFLTTGPAVPAFEAALAERQNTERAVVCANGTAALHLAAMALDMGPGDKAIIPAVTFVATANAVRMTGADVIFADVDADSGLMEAAHLEEALGRAGEGAKSVFPVHLGGQSGDMQAIYGVARGAGLAIVSDACHALGGSYKAGNELLPLGDGQLEDMACFSFHPVKSMTTGEGGAITTNDPALADKMELLRSHCITRDPDAFVHENEAFDSEGNANPWYYEMHSLGYNYRATDFQCALGLSQLKKLSGFIDRRQQLADQYGQLLKPLAASVQPLKRSEHCRSAWHLYAILVDFAGLGRERAMVMESLREAGIGTQVHYIPVTKQPYYSGGLNGAEFPGAESYYQRSLSLPLFPGMDDDDPARVISALVSALGL